MYQEYERDIVGKGKVHVENLLKIVKKYDCFIEGHIFDIPKNLTDGYREKRYNIYRLAKSAENIMEIGFNTGFSVLLYLIANDTSKIQLFDIGEYDYCRECYEYLDTQFPGRLSIVWGDSRETIPIFSTHIKYDLIHIDGGHESNIVIRDILNCQKLASSDTVVIIDDTHMLQIYELVVTFIRNGFITHVQLPYYTIFHVGIKYLKD